MNGIANIAARSSRPARIALAGIAAAASFAAFSGSASAADSCDLVAAPNGSDSAAGTVASPFATPQKLVASLAEGQTGCLRDGSYGSADKQIKLATPNTTLTSYPGEQAEVAGRMWISQEGDDVTVSNLQLDGRNPGDLPSPTVNTDDVVIRDNDITNYHTAICVSLGTAETYGRAHRTLI